MEATKIIDEKTYIPSIIDEENRQYHAALVRLKDDLQAIANTDEAAWRDITNAASEYDVKIAGPIGIYEDNKSLSPIADFIHGLQIDSTDSLNFLNQVLWMFLRIHPKSAYDLQLLDEVIDIYTETIDPQRENHPLLLDKLNSNHYQTFEEFRMHLQQAYGIKIEEYIRARCNEYTDAGSSYRPNTLQTKVSSQINIQAIKQRLENTTSLSLPEQFIECKLYDLAYRTPLLHVLKSSSVYIETNAFLSRQEMISKFQNAKKNGIFQKGRNDLLVDLSVALEDQSPESTEQLPFRQNKEKILRECLCLYFLQMQMNCSPMESVRIYNFLMLKKHGISIIKLPEKSSTWLVTDSTNSLINTKLSEKRNALIKLLTTLLNLP